MVNGMRVGGRGSNLGVRPLMGRLEGGFSASAIPRPGSSRPRSGSNSTIITGSATRPASFVVPGSESSVGGIPASISELSDTSVSALILSLKQSLQETTSKLERRMANMEQQRTAEINRER